MFWGPFRRECRTCSHLNSFVFFSLLMAHMTLSTENCKLRCLETRSREKGWTNIQHFIPLTRNNEEFHINFSILISFANWLMAKRCRDPPQRGPKSHASGLGRTVLLSCRGLFVFEAFAAGEACFLGSKEWRAIVSHFIEEQRRAKVGRITQLIDYAFNEVAQCPGFLAMTKSLISSSCTTSAERENLVCAINTS